MENERSASELPTVTVGGFPTVRLTRTALAQTMVTDCRDATDSSSSGTPRLVFSSNGQGIALAGRSNEFASAMKEADIIHADGMPVVMTSRLTGAPLPERICTTDFFHDAAIAAIEHNLSFYILGATEDQNAAAVKTIKELYPSLTIAGRHHGYFDEKDDLRICSLIRESGADVLWVALGKPRQEFWCVRNRANLVGVGWLKTCGGLYGYLAGDEERAPTWVQRSGLEWLYRLKTDPRRLIWRYIVTNPYAFYLLIRRTDFAARRKRKLTARNSPTSSSIGD